MPMVNEELRNNLRNAFKNYQESQTGSKKLSARRANDLHELNAIVSKSVTTTELFFKISKRVDEIETGWWIFRTAQSKLKESCRKILFAKKDPLINFLQQDIETSLQRADSAPSDDDPNPKIQVLLTQIKNHRMSDNNLNEKNTVLQAQLHELKEKNSVLSEVNKMLRNKITLYEQEEFTVERPNLYNPLFVMHSI